MESIGSMESVGSMKSAGSVASMEEVSKQIAKKIIHISAFKMKLLIAAVSVETVEAIKALEAACSIRAAIGALSCAAVKGRVAKPVVQLLLFRIAQHLIGLRHFLKHLFCLLVARIRIGMIFLCQFSVCFFNRCGVRISINAQHLIIISLASHILLHPFFFKTGFSFYPQKNLRRSARGFFCSTCNITAIYTAVKSFP